MKKTRKDTQLSLTNFKRAGRPAINDRGIRHIRRDRITKPTSMHLTIKVREYKADIKSKRILRALHHAIIRARLKKLKVIHYTLEYNHVHLLVEASDHKVMHRGMQALGISLSKSINKIKCLKGTVYKHRYHLKRLTSTQQLKNVLHYIFNNGIHHKRTSSILDPYNSMPAEMRLEHIYKSVAKKIQADINRSDFLKQLQMELKGILDVGEVFFNGLRFLKS
ncbi:MAG: transposase [Bacteriovorax sp.]|nr:transposase [Bacteriovorax sp.]